MRDDRPTATTVTDEQLAAFGFPVEKTDKVVGTKVVVRAGSSRRVAVFGAWEAGFVRMAVSPAPVGARTWADENGKPKPVPDPEVLAWAAASKRVSA